MRKFKATAAALLAVLLPGTALAAPKPVNDPFVVAMNHEPDTLDPTISVNTVISRPSLENIIEPLVALDSKGNLVPGLASWKYSDGNKVLTFKIRPGVKFHSGDPLTADDVIFSHERMKKRSAVYRSRLHNLIGVKKIDNLTVQFIFKAPDMTFMPPRTLEIVSKAYYDRVGEAAFVAHPVGTGPYEFVSYQPGQAMVLKAFDGYWGGVPAVKNVRLVYVHEDTTRVAMLEAGEADMILNVPFGDKKRLEQEGFKTAEIAVTPTVSVQFTLNNPKDPWHDVRVREAVAHAIDADSIIKGLFQGIPKHYAAFGPDEVGYDPNLKNYKYDPALSKKLLAEAGYPHGFKMPLYWWHGENFGLKETAEAVALYLQKVGITAKVSSVDVPEFVAKMRAAKKEPSTESWVGITPSPLADYFDPICALAFAFWSASPLAQYHNPDFDKLVAKAVQTVDPIARGNLVRKATRIMHADVPQIPLWNNIAIYAMKPDVNFVPVPKNLVRATIKDVTLSDK